MSSQMPESIESSVGEVQPWIPYQRLKEVDITSLRLSRGFLRSAPARWFPGLSAHWLPLLHANGIEFQVLDVVPLAKYEDELQALGAWSLDDEMVVVYSDSFSRSTLAEAIVPASGRCARQVVIEYLCRRIAVSLQSSWSGKDSAQVNFDAEFDASNFRPHAWVRVRAVLNDNKVNFVFGVSRLVAEKLDGLWRRQLRSTRAQQLIGSQGNSMLRIELTRLSVGPQALPAYLRSGSLIDLEIPLSSNVTLRVGDEPFVSASLCHCDEKFVTESQALHGAALQIFEGATPLSIEFGRIAADATLLTEIEQQGAMLESGLPVSDEVSLNIRGEKVGRAKLVTFEGRFAISVL